jgi:hypothetical protein
LRCRFQNPAFVRLIEPPPMTLARSRNDGGGGGISLLLEIISLFRKKYSLLSEAGTFMKNGCGSAFPALETASEGSKSQFSLLFSLIAGNCVAETGSHPTASATTHSLYVRQHRLDGGRFVIAEFVAYDLRAPVSELESCSGQRDQPAMTVATPLML